MTLSYGADQRVQTDLRKGGRDLKPWTILKTYRRERNAIFSEGYCAVDNPHVKIGGENYMLGADGLLMPAKKGQKPPDLRHFK